MNYQKQFQNYKSNAIKGAKTGAQIGGMLGTVLPGVGNVLGAAGGAIAGAGFGNLVSTYQAVTNPNQSIYQPQRAIFAKYGAELEKQETVLRPDRNLVSFNGPSHEQGGIPYSPKHNSEFVFSDSIGFNSQNKLSMTPTKSFAKMSKKFQGDDPVSQNTLSALKSENQKVLRMFQAPQFGFRYGGTPKKYSNGGPINPFGLNFSPATNTPLATMTQPVNSQLLQTGMNYRMGQLQGSPDVGMYDNITAPSPLNASAPNYTAPTPSMATEGISPNLLPAAADSVNSFLNGNAGRNASALLKIPGTAYNLIKGLGPATEDPLRLNRQMDDAINLMANREYDPEAAYQAITRQSNAARARTQGTNPFLNIAQNQAITNSAQAAMAQANLSGQQMNNQYRAQEAATRAQLGSEERQIQRERDVSNLQNVAARNSFLQQSFQDMSAIGDAINEGKVTKAQIEEGMLILRNTFPNVTVDFDTIMEKLNSGEGLSDQEAFQLQTMMSIYKSNNNGNQ